MAAANGTDCADVFAKDQALDGERESGCVGEKVIDPAIPKGANPKAPGDALPPKSPWGN